MVPTELCDVISATSAICPRLRSSGAATELGHRIGAGAGHVRRGSIWLGNRLAAAARREASRSLACRLGGTSRWVRRVVATGRDDEGLAYVHGKLRPGALPLDPAGPEPQAPFDENSGSGALGPAGAGRLAFLLFTTSPDARATRQPTPCALKRQVNHWRGKQCQQLAQQQAARIGCLSYRAVLTITMSNVNCYRFFLIVVKLNTGDTINFKSCAFVFCFLPRHVHTAY